MLRIEYFLKIGYHLENMQFMTCLVLISIISFPSSCFFFSSLLSISTNIKMATQQTTALELSILTFLQTIIQHFQCQVTKCTQLRVLSFHLLIVGIKFNRSVRNMIRLTRGIIIFKSKTNYAYSIVAKVLLSHFLLPSIFC